MSWHKLKPVLIFTLVSTLYACSSGDDNNPTCFPSFIGDRSCGTTNNSSSSSSGAPVLPPDGSSSSSSSGVTASSASSSSSSSSGGQTNNVPQIQNPSTCTPSDLSALASVAPQTRVITGTITYNHIPQLPNGTLDYANPLKLPAYGAKVAALACDGSDVQVVGEGLGRVDKNGRYEMRVPTNLSVTVGQIRTQGRQKMPYFRESAERLSSVANCSFTPTVRQTGECLAANEGLIEVTVVDNANQFQVHEYNVPGAGALPASSTTQNLDIEIPSGLDAAGQSTGTRSSAPFAVLATSMHTLSAMLKTRDYAVLEEIVAAGSQGIATTSVSNMQTNQLFVGLGRRYQISALDEAKITIGWSASNTTTLPTASDASQSAADYAAGRIGRSHYDYVGRRIFLLGQLGVNTDEFDVDVINRYLSEFVADNLILGVRSVSNAAVISGRTYTPLFANNQPANFLAGRSLDEFNAYLDPIIAFREGYNVGFASALNSTFATATASLNPKNIIPYPNAIYPQYNAVGFYRDSRGSASTTATDSIAIDIENTDSTTHSVGGWYNMQTVAAIVHDMIDFQADGETMNILSYEVVEAFNSSHAGPVAMPSVISFISDMKRTYFRTYLNSVSGPQPLLVVRNVNPSHPPFTYQLPDLTNIDTIVAKHNINPVGEVSDNVFVFYDPAEGTVENAMGRVDPISTRAKRIVIYNNPNDASKVPAAYGIGQTGATGVPDSDILPIYPDFGQFGFLAQEDRSNGVGALFAPLPNGTVALDQRYDNLVGPGLDARLRSVTQKVCVINNFGSTGYHLGNRKFIAFSVFDPAWFLGASNGSAFPTADQREDPAPDVVIQVTYDAANSDPAVTTPRLAVTLRYHGKVVSNSDTLQGPNATADQTNLDVVQSLPPGGYQLELTHFGNMGLSRLAGQAIIPGKVCYDVTIKDAVLDSLAAPLFDSGQLSYAAD